MDEEDIYNNVGKHRWPYVDEPRPATPRPRRPDGSAVPAAPVPAPKPVTGGAVADA